MKTVNYYIILLVISISQIAFADFTPAEAGNKGLFNIQFSWNSDSYSKKISVEVEYKKKGFLTKKKASGTTAFHAVKNQFINLELAEGEYELSAVRLRGPEIGYNKYLKIPLAGSFVITAGKVTNGGLIYLIRENKTSDNVMALRINNTTDVQRYVASYKKEFTSSDSNIQPAWKFLENEKVDKLVQSFAKLLAQRESARKRPKVTHLYASLGMVLKLEKDSQGTVTSHELIPTPSYQQIKNMTLQKDGTIICTLENGSFLFGNNEKLNYMPLPEGLEGMPDLQLIKNDRFLLVDTNFNIFSADDSFNWKAQTDFRYERKAAGFFAVSVVPAYPKVYKGKQHLYIYSPSNDHKHKVLLQSGYDEIDFRSIPLSKEVKRVPLVTETPTHIIIGPHTKLNATAKRPAYLYVKEHSQDEWLVRNLPRGDCKRFYPGKDQSILYTECSKNNWFESSDYGVTWSKWKAGSK